ncbi:MAG: hypothetical protein ACO4AU_16240 [bacterium]
MNQIRKCLVLLHEGRSIHEINRLSGAHRKTIHNMLQRLAHYARELNRRHERRAGPRPAE